MKRVKKAIAAVVIASMGVLTASAQDSTAVESTNGFDTGLDIYSSYIFRGSKFGTGPAFQPWVSYTYGGFSIGSWGSVSSGAEEASEMDLYAAYEFGFGLSLGVTDYYYTGNDWMNYTLDSTGSHGLEVNAGYSIKGISLAANYIPTQSLGAGTAGGDMYFELGYEFEKFSVFAGAGDGWHSADGEFKLVNLGISTGKEVEITDKYSLPISGSVIVNPDKKELFLAVGLSF